MTQVVTDKRTAVLDATLSLVVERGFHATPMSKIAKHAGVSAGIIYHYFENKDDLILELYREIKRQFGAALLTDDLHDLPFDRKMKCIWLNAYHFYWEHPKEALFLDQFESSPYQHDITEADYGEDIQALAVMLQEGYTEGWLKDFPQPVLYEMTFRVAGNLARRQIEGAVTLDDSRLNLVADAICSAVLR